MPRNGRPQALSKTDKRFIIQIKIDPKTSPKDYSCTWKLWYTCCH